MGRPGRGSGNTTTIYSESGLLQAAGSWAQGDWLNFELAAPVALDPNTVYGVDVQHVTGGDWGNGIPYLRREGNDFAGGSRYNRVDGDPATANLVGNSDFIFHANIAIPEPSTAALLGLGGLALILRRRK